MLKMNFRKKLGVIFSLLLILSLTLGAFPDTVFAAATNGVSAYSSDGSGGSDVSDDIIVVYSQASVKDLTVFSEDEEIIEPATAETQSTDNSDETQTPDNSDIQPSNEEENFDNLNKSGKNNASRDRKFSRYVSERKAVSNKVDLITPAEDIDTDELIDVLNDDPNVLCAGRNFTRQLSAVPNDALYSLQWWFGSVGADKTWDKVNNPNTVVVAVIDSGLDTAHPDIQNRYVQGYDYITKSTNMTDQLGHGTKVSGCIAAIANNGIGVAGVAGSANIKIAPYRAGSGNTLDGAYIVAALYAAADRPEVRVINMSYGGYFNSPYTFTMPPESALQRDPEYQAIKYAAGKGKVLVAASGNEGDVAGLQGAYSYPASFSDVISVAAIDSDNSWPGFSQYNNAVELCAPGVSVSTTSPSNSYSSSSGTSFASPIAAGCAAVLIADYPTLTAPQVRSILSNTAQNLGDKKYFGNGKVRIDSALSSIKKVTGIQINHSSASLRVGETLNLIATVTPQDATNATVLYLTDNQNVATVSPTGLITANGVGTATVYAVSQDSYGTGYDKAATCTVTVLSTPVAGISLDPANTTCEVGRTRQLTATVIPWNATNKSIIYQTDDPNIVVVSPTGLITGKGIGAATITATTQEGGFSAACTVTVSQAIASYQPNKLPATGIRDTKIEVQTMNGAVSQSVTSSNRNIINVNGNILELIKAGKAKITVKYQLKNAKTGKLTTKTISKTITVISKVEGITLDKSSATISRKSKVTLKAAFIPSDATNKTVTWKSSNSKVATVTSKGVVTGVGGGTAVITATTKDGGKTAEASITVTPIYPTAVKLNKTSVSLAKGKTFQLKATLVPSTTDFKTVIWESSDESIAKVVNGKVTAGQIPGACVITATSTIDNTKLARCTVTVLPQKVTSVKFGATPATVNAGSDLNMGEKLIVAPANADNRTVTWSSSNSNVASVDENGIVTFKAGGKVTIKATANDGSKKSASKAFTVKQLVSTINLNATEITLAKGKTFTLKATVLPGTASNKAVTWTSSNSKVATVSSSGVVKGIAASSEPVTITCRAKDGSGIIAQCTVWVE